jgi:hypothetical protein
MTFGESAILSSALALLLLMTGVAAAAQFTIEGPVGSGEFGRAVFTLPNGNLVVTDPGFDAPGPIVDVGAVYLYRPDGSLISTLRGASANDRVGSDGVVVLANGNYVVRSPLWDDGAALNAGAVTFGSATTGISGVVSASNSLVGGTTGDEIGGVLSGVTALGNGNYVVQGSAWDNGPAVDAGAVTFGSGTTGVSGVVSAANSLVGSRAGDRVGNAGVTLLSNDNYVVSSTFWDNGLSADVGAVTFGSGSTGISGLVSPANSLIGRTPQDQVGSVTTLTNGNFVVRSPRWDNSAAIDAGAVTFGSGATGVVGMVTPGNSLVGSQANDQVGSTSVIALTSGNFVVRSPMWDNGVIANAGAVTFGSGTSGVDGEVTAANSLVGGRTSDAVGTFLTALENGNYVVASPLWDNGPQVNVGAATFGSGTSGIVGLITPANSLVGDKPDDQVGSDGVTALANGNYVVRSRFWSNGNTGFAGAATFGSGTTGISGAVSPANSLVGTTTNDLVGILVTALRNGNYVVGSPLWANGSALGAGAATFGSGTTGISGAISATNSLVGSSAGDRVGDAFSVIALDNGNYVVRSRLWDHGAAVDAGAVTFGSGTSGISGEISPTNSLVGGTSGDRVGEGVTALSTGNYVVRSPGWRNSAAAAVGAATWGSGTTGIRGLVNTSNSLIGNVAGDVVSSAGVTALGNGSFVVRSDLWDNGAIVDAGAVTLALVDGSVVGAITSTHSVLGTVATQGASHSFGYDVARNQLAVGQPASNRVVLHRTGIATSISIVGDSPDPSSAGQLVTVTATVSAMPGAPTDGKVSFRASSGESCVDASPSATSPTTADFSCTITFTNVGVSTLIAEYTGSVIHAYSGSAPEDHTTVAEAPVFDNGFEGP